MKLIDRFAHLTQSVAKLLLLLPLHGDLDQRNHAHSQDGEHGNCDHQLNQRESGELRIANCELRSFQIRNPKSEIRNLFSYAHVTELPTRFLRTTLRHVTSDSLAAAPRRLGRVQSLFSRDYLAFARCNFLPSSPSPPSFRSPRLSLPLRARRQAHHFRSKRRLRREPHIPP